MSLRALSEAIILQSAEDILSSSHRKEGMDFFGGEGFRLCAEMACMTFDEKLKFLHMLLGCLASGKRMGECSENVVSGIMKSRKSSHSHRSKRSAQLTAV